MNSSEKVLKSREMPNFNIGEIYPILLRLKQNKFPQYGKGSYVYKDDIGNVKCMYLEGRKEQSKEEEKYRDSHVYVPTREELEKECHEVFAEIFRYHSPKYYSSIVVDLKISENKIKFDDKQKISYPAPYLTEKEIFTGLASLYECLEYLNKLKYDEKQLRNYSILWFLAGVAIAVIVILKL